MMIIIISDNRVRPLLASSQSLQCVCRPWAGCRHLWVKYDNKIRRWQLDSGDCIMIIIFDNGHIGTSVMIVSSLLSK